MGYSQDIVYSQFYNAPNYLNPALNGQFDADLRVNMIVKSQWNGEANLSSYTFSADLSLPKLNGGLGLMMTKSNEGNANQSKTNFSGIYSYSVSSGNTTLYFGLQAGISKRSIDYSRLIFQNQLDAELGIVQGNSMADVNNGYYFDTGAGINLVKGNFMMGVSAQHLNKPNQSLINAQDLLPVRFNTNLSYQILMEDAQLIPSVVYYKQADIHSHNIGMQYKKGGMNLGLWLRGSDLKTNALVASVIFDIFTHRQHNKLRLGISRDTGVTSDKNRAAFNSTEAALNYELSFRGSTQNNESGAYGGKCYNFY